MCSPPIPAACCGTIRPTAGRLRRARERIGPGWAGLKAGFVADWNADGVNDIIAQWKSGTLTVYRGKLSGGFLSPVTVGTAGWQSMNITVGKWHSGHRYPGWWERRRTAPCTSTRTPPAVRSAPGSGSGTGSRA